jgi:hypothetical protein
MNLHLRNTVSTVVLFCYVGTGILVELTHHDAFAFSSQSHSTVEQHDCDAHERHLSPEASHCLACTHANHRVATEARSYLPQRLPDVVHRKIFTAVEQTFESDFYHSGKRGPPSRFA